MYIRKIKITNIRSIEQMEWELPADKPLPGWHVFLGNNGSGKSSIIRSVALALIGPHDAQYLRQNWKDWIRGSSEKASVSLLVNFDKAYEQALLSEISLDVEISKRFPKLDEYYHLTSTENNHDLEEIVTDNIRASFGPFRRFSGGDPKYLDAYYQNPIAAPHLSAFGEDVSLEGALQWLKNLSKDRRTKNEPILNLIRQLINSENFLPNNITLEEFSDDEIIFVTENKVLVSIEQLGDGMRATISILFEIMHQLILSLGVLGADGIRWIVHPDNPNRIITSGIVQIDEVDAHLHPLWQQKIGFWLTKHFPNIQFIVTTHSPLICQAATTVYKLPTPGSDEEGRFLDDLELDRLRYGNILEAYASEAFGKIERSDDGKKKLERLVELERFSWERELTDEERNEQRELQAIFIASPVGLDDIKIKDTLP